MGASGSKEKLLNSLPETGERFYGLENFGNTCYANSVRPHRLDGDKACVSTSLAAISNWSNRCSRSRRIRLVAAAN